MASWPALQLALRQSQEPPAAQMQKVPSADPLSRCVGCEVPIGVWKAKAVTAPSPGFIRKPSSFFSCSGAGRDKQAQGAGQTDSRLMWVPSHQIVVHVGCQTFLVF